MRTIEGYAVLFPSPLRGGAGVGVAPEDCSQTTTSASAIHTIKLRTLLFKPVAPPLCILTPPLTPHHGAAMLCMDVEGRGIP